MSKSKFYWVAKFNSCPNIKQFDDNGKEHAIKEVMALHNDLKYFCLSHVEKNFIVTVDIRNGLIFINDQQEIVVPELISNTDKKFRLIYFRRIREILNSNFNTLDSKCFNILGYQYTDETGNHKVLWQIDENCNIVVGGN